MFKFLKNRKRRELRAKPLDSLLWSLIDRNAPLVRRLGADERDELGGLIRIFLHEKNFEGCGELAMSDEIRLTIAAQACLLLLGRETDVFPKVDSVLVYPTTFVARVVEEDETGLVYEEDDPRDGEAWETGAVVLAWDDVLYASDDAGDGYNVVLHEFAHQLDLESGDADGAPPLDDRVDPETWAGTFEREYEAHVRAVDRDRAVLLDPYGADHPAEFFAVATECFFGRPAELRRRHRALFDLLAAYYGRDPLRKG